MPKTKPKPTKPKKRRKPGPAAARLKIENPCAALDRLLGKRASK